MERKYDTCRTESPSLRRERAEGYQEWEGLSLYVSSTNSSHPSFVLPLREVATSRSEFDIYFYHQT